MRMYPAWRDRRVREQALQVGLELRADAAAEERKDGQHEEELAPVDRILRAVRCRRCGSSAANPAALVADAMKAVTGLGAPSYTSGVHMWNGTAATLNARPTSSNTMPASSVPSCDEHVGAQEVLDPDERRGPGGAVGERHAVEQHRGGERAEHEVLDAGFERARTGAVVGGQHVQRDREHLECHEHDDEVVGAGHHEHAGRGEQHQRDVFGAGLESRG